MKIGILTFQYAINYGAVLQLYSLQKSLKDLGYDTEIINYIPNDFNINSIRSILRNSGLKNRNSTLKAIANRVILNLKYQNKLCSSFKKFSDDNFNLSSLCNDDNWEDAFEKYDAIVVGSDQVWNPTNQLGKVYFLDSDKLECARIAYAADSTSQNVRREDIDRLKNALLKFSAVSVRNIHSQKFVQKITGNEPQIVADPVVLNDFSEFCKKSKLTEKYAFVYLLGKEINGGHTAAIQSIKNKYPDIKIYQAVMLKQNEFTVLDDADRLICDCTPDEWLNLIYNSEFVYTDSFHCILFSLKFHKEFLSYYADELRAPRLIALKNQYNLGSRIVSSVDDISKLSSLDYELNFSDIDDIFAHQKEESIKFLKSSMKGENKSNG